MDFNIQLKKEKQEMDFTLSKEQDDVKNAAREFALGEFPDRAKSLIGRKN